MHKDTKMMKALNEEFEVVSSFKSLNKCIELAKDMKLTVLDFNHNEA